ncbi:MAG: hypothetical protein IJ071_04445 [Ruminococcus sp.]|nr:hypothetical protein [Ruminococcus sp.]
MKVTVTIDKNVINKIVEAARQAAPETLEVLYTNLTNETKTMPFDTGDMQNDQTFVETTDEGAVLITGSPQARRLYYHPDYMVDSKTGAGPFPIKDESGNIKGFRYHKGARLVPDPNGRKLIFQRGKNPNAGAYWLEPYISGSKKEFVQAEFTEAFKRRAGL